MFIEIISLTLCIPVLFYNDCKQLNCMNELMVTKIFRDVFMWKIAYGITE